MGIIKISTLTQMGSSVKRGGAKLMAKTEWTLLGAGFAIASFLSGCNSPQDGVAPTQDGSASKTSGAAPTSSNSAFTPARVLWVDQRHPNATDAGQGTEDAPFKTISQAAKSTRPGDLVRIRTGVYRELVEAKASGEAGKPIRFEAAPGAHVVVTGADVIEPKSLTREGDGNIFSLPWKYKFETHPDDEFHKMIGRCEQVVVNGVPLHQVLAREQMSRGSFFADTDKQRLYFWSRDNYDAIKNSLCFTGEASTRTQIWAMKGDNLQTSGIVFRYAANRAQLGAVALKGNFDLIENCEIETTNGCGLEISGSDVVVRNCLIRDHGQLGFGAYHADRLLVTGCEIRDNGTKGFNRGWEAGGDKLCLCRKAVIENCIVANNHGTGIWFDVGNEDCEVRNCLISNNEESGVFYEISYGLHAHDNVIVGNGFSLGFGSWGAKAAITLYASPGGLIERNLMLGNYIGFQFTDSRRDTPRIGQAKNAKSEAVWNHDQVIRNNVIAWNETAQVAYSYDNPDHRHWPLAMRSQFDSQTKGLDAADNWKDYQAKDNEGQPLGLTLEKLNFSIDGNLYSRTPGELLFQWGVPWRDNKKYEELGILRSELKFETKGVESALVFADTAKLDFRVPRDSLALKMDCYPKGDVPGAKLGAISVLNDEK